MARISKHGRGSSRPNDSNRGSRKNFFGRGQGGGSRSGKRGFHNGAPEGRGSGNRGVNKGGGKRDNHTHQIPPHDQHQGSHLHHKNQNTSQNTDSLDAHLDDIIHAKRLAFPQNAYEEGDYDELKPNKTTLMTATIGLATHILHCQEKIRNCTCAAYNESPTTPRTPLDTMAHNPDVNSFLGRIKSAVDNNDSHTIRETLQLIPERKPAYAIIQKELIEHYPPSGKNRPNAKLKKKCQDILQNGQLHPWQALPDVVLAYLEFLRKEMEVQQDIEDIQNGLEDILRQCVLALSDASQGVLILPFTLDVAKILTRICIGLDKQPKDFAAPDKITGNGRKGVKKVASVEDCANLIRDAFIKCLADKTGTSGFQGAGRRSRPENKRMGIYSTANLCLKLLLQCGKLRNAEMMFTSIDAQSPPLSFYPASQRVSFLYYLGRYHFANNHFFRAQATLQAAYDQCHVQALNHRRLILTYLIASNICLGRFPSSKVLSRLEISKQASRWMVLCRIISRGDISELRRYLALDSEIGNWFLSKHMLLQLQNRCEVLVWRSLVRRVFIVAGYHGGEDRTVPFLRLGEVQAAADWLESGRAMTEGIVIHQAATSFGQQQESPPLAEYHDNLIFYTDDDFSEVDNAIEETGFDIDRGVYTTEDYSHENDFADSVRNEPPQSLNTGETESIICSLVNQGFLKGFVTHSNPRFAIPGAKSRGALATGFPNIWKQILSVSSDEIPGWVKDEK